VENKGKNDFMDKLELFLEVTIYPTGFLNGTSEKLFPKLNFTEVGIFL
jgi:hypothetical protein